MPSLTVENYLKAILKISLTSKKDWIATGQLALALNVSPGTVTSMIKSLDESTPRLAVYKPYEGVSLTEAGRTIGLKMLRRHRLIELFLTQTLKLSWDQVHEEAEDMEHAVSDFLIDCIDEYLDHPERDPHGDPIPSSAGKMRGNLDSEIPLSSCQPQMMVRFIRVSNQHTDFLRFLSDAGFELGIEGRIQENNHQAGLITLLINQKSLSLGYQAAESLFVEEITPKD